MNTVLESMSFQVVGRCSVRSGCLALKEIGSVSTSVALILYHFAHVALLLVLSVRSPFSSWIPYNVKCTVCDF
jgi:hypothetical protein